MTRSFFIAAMLLALSGATARAVTIDDFTVAPIELERTIGQSGPNTAAVQTGLPVEHVAGGVRS